MNITIGYSCLSTDNDNGFYHLKQLLAEGHNITLIAESGEFEEAKRWMMEQRVEDKSNCFLIKREFETDSLRSSCIHIEDNVGQLNFISCIFKTPRLLFFSCYKGYKGKFRRVESWWEIYNFVRYEYEPARR
jgi:hypothetical protein